MKIVKKKRKLKVERLAVVVLTFSLLLSLATSLFLRSYNNALTMEVQTIQVNIQTLKLENDAHKVTIQNLSNKDRIFDIAEQDGLSMNQSNVVTVGAGN